MATRELTKGDPRVNTARGHVTLLCVTACVLGAEFRFGGATASAQEPYEVIVYEQPNFEGNSASFKLDPAAMRQRLVPCHMPYKVSSIKVGSKVGVDLFAGPDFVGTPAQASRRMRFLHAEKDVSSLYVDPGAACSSLIVFPRDAGQPLGVWFLEFPWPFPVVGQFFPLPEMRSEVRSKYGTVGVWDNRARFVALPAPNTYATLYDLPGCTGKSIGLPGAAAMTRMEPAGFVMQGFEPLEKYGFAGTVSSLEVGLLTSAAWKVAGVKSVVPVISGIWNSNMVGHKPVTDIKGDGESIEITQSGGQFTWKLKGTTYEGSIEGSAVTTSGVKGTITQIEPGGMAGMATRIEWNNGMVFYRKTPPRVAGAHPAGQQSGVASIAGAWESSLGNVYEITQNGSQFNWFAAKTSEQASGTVSGKGVSASWQGPGGPGSAKGSITQVDAGGTATRIDWDNGVVFTRKASPPAGGLPSPPAGGLPAPPAGGFPAPPAGGLPAPTAVSVEPNTERPGTDLRNFPVPGFEECRKACADDAACRAYTFSRSVQGGVCWLKASYSQPLADNCCVSGVKQGQAGSAAPAAPQPPTAPPVTPAAPDVSGKWNSSIGVVYEITQGGSEFSWNAAALNQKASGTLTGNDVSASWSGATGAGSAKGKISQVDATGRATRIEWDNGVVFSR